MRFFFRGIVSQLDPRRLVGNDPTFVRLRRHMIDDLGMEAVLADRLLDDMLARALTRFGDQFVRGKTQLLDRVVDLRGRLDTLYHRLLNFDARSRPGVETRRLDPATVGTIDDQLREIGGLYRQLDEALTELGRPLDEVIPLDDTIRSAAERTAREVSDVIEAGRTRERSPIRRLPGHEHREIELDISQGRLSRRGWKPVAGSDNTVFRRHFKTDGSDAELRIEHGRYQVRIREATGIEHNFGEYDILTMPYARRPLTTTLLQAHHGLQNSLLTELFGRYGYDGGAAPTIWLRNSRAGSPHGAITAVQNANRSSRATSLTTLESVRRAAIEDLALTSMPQNRITAYIRAFDEYFERAVLPRIPAADRARLLGNWRPPSGAPL